MFVHSIDACNFQTFMSQLLLRYSITSMVTDKFQINFLLLPLSKLLCLQVELYWLSFVSFRFQPVSFIWSLAYLFRCIKIIPTKDALQINIIIRLFFIGEAIWSRLIKTRPSLLLPLKKQFESNTHFNWEIHVYIFIYMYLNINLIFNYACVSVCMYAYVKGLLDRDSFASQLATQMQMERLHPKIEMLLTIHSCRVPCIYAQASHCAALQQCAASVHRERVLLTRSPNGWDHFKQRCNSLVDWRMKARY